MATPVGENKLLESWKEISAYLKRSERTCRRWEETLGLPVHRLDGTPNARVFAYSHELDRWLREKLHHAVAISVSLKKKALARIAWATAVIVVLAGLFFLARPLLNPAPEPVPGNNPVLLILPFQNLSGDPALDSWRLAFPELLITDLRQSRYLNVIPVRALHVQLAVLELLKAPRLSDKEKAAIAERLTPDFIASGTVDKKGDGIVVEITVRPNAKPSAEPAAQAAGTPEVLRAVVRDEQALLDCADTMSRQIKNAAGLTRRQIAADIDAGVRRIATASPEALKLYARADWPIEWGPYPEMVPAIEKALAIDPGFGMAYRLMFEAYGGARPEELVRCYEQALSLGDRMSERERLLLQARFYNFYRYQTGFSKIAESGVPAATIERLKPRTRREAKAVLDRLATLYPDFFDSAIPLMNLGMIHMDAEEWDEAIAVMEKALPASESRRSPSVERLVECYLAGGRVEKAEEAVDALEARPPGRSYPGLRRDIALKKRSYKEAIEYIKKIYAQDGRAAATPYAYSSETGYVRWLADDLAAAELAYRAQTGPPDPGIEMYRALDLAVLSLSQGKIGQAIAEAQKGLDLAVGTKEIPASQEVRRFRHLLSYLYRLAGRLPEALMASEEACRDYERPDLEPAHAVKLLSMQALVDLEMDRVREFDRRIVEIRAYCERESCPRLMRAYHYLVGLRELREGRGRRAIAEFLKALDLSLPRTQRDDGTAILYALGQAYESVGDPGKAAASYEQIADPVERESFAGDLYALSFYRKAKLLERLQSLSAFPQDADTLAVIKAGYRKFLGLFGGADPLFAAQVEDARRRLAALGSE